MTIQEGLITLTKDAVESLIRSVTAMPQDKLSLKLSEHNKTTLDLLEEIATTMPWNTQVLSTFSADGEMNPTGATTAAEYATIIRNGAEGLYKAIAEFPEDTLKDTLDLPWGTMSYLDIMAYPYWNIMWHLGQISYVQISYGDNEMH